ncbi:hypothetical protein DUNSADRAFT_12358 [Dunaliella salina]|uniref:Uncharacterized protein n=1 Tax=Dunaliella salina TaxID=3046 RepID=A0ABQ7GBQ3_DUNSA|nr:hypothetical protein DUNSADRAFT_12358 [Dunaliella salina]|eukprot:KAF5831943.1 hypothetical protein DUNSADRAFT_12358 [Dunaliella salina]
MVEEPFHRLLRPRKLTCPTVIFTEIFEVESPGEEAALGGCTSEKGVHAMSPRFKARQEEENKEDINQDGVVERSSRSAEKKQTHAHSNFLSKLRGRMASIRQATQPNACSAHASPAKPLPPGSTSSPTASKKRSSPPTQSRAPQPSASPYLNRNLPMPGGALSAAPAPSPPRLAVAPCTTDSSTRSPSPTAAASSVAAAAAAAAPAAAPAAAAAAAAVPPHPAFLSQHLPTRSPSGSLAQPLHQVPSHIQQDQSQPLQSTMTYQPHSLPSAPPSPSFTPTPSPSASMSSFKGGTNSSASPNKARTRSSPTPATPLSLLSAQERRRRRQDLLTAEALSAAQHSTASLRSPSPCLAPGSVQQDGEARGYPRLLHYYEDHGKSNSPASHHHHHHHHRHHHHQQQQQPLQHWQQPGAAAADAAAAAAQLAAPGSHISPPHGIVGLRSVGRHSNGSGDALASASKHKRTSPAQQHSPHPHALPTVADLPPSPLAAPQLPPSYTEVQPPSKPGDNVLTLPTNALDSGPCSCGSPGSGAGWAVSPTPTPSCSSTPRSMAQAGEITVPPVGSGSSSPGSQVDTKGSHQSKCMSARPSSCSPDSPGSAKGSRRRRRRRSSSTRPSEGRQKRRRPSSSRQHRNRRPTSSSSSPDPDGASPLACSPAGTTSTSSAPAVNPRAVLWVPPASPFSLLEEVRRVLGSGQG